MNRKKEKTAFSKRKHVCIDCGKRICWQTVKYGQSRCNPCNGKLKQKIKNCCKGCGKRVSFYAKRCRDCDNNLKNKTKIEKKCIDCGKKIYYKSIRCGSCSQKGHKVSQQTRINMGKGQKKRLKNPKNHPAYVGELNRSYPLKFRKIKILIRERDRHTCQLCNKKEKFFDEKLHVHHIDYDIDNCNESNLISLCRSCHTKTNFNRDYWYAYFTYIKEN